MNSKKGESAIDIGNESGPYFFVVDHSDYRGGAVPGEQPTALDAFVEMTVTKKKFGL